MKIIRNTLGAVILCGLFSASAMASSILCPSASVIKSVHFDSIYTGQSGDSLVYSTEAVSYLGHNFIVGMGPFPDSNSGLTSKANALLPSVTESLTASPVDHKGLKTCLYKTSDARLFVMAALK